MPDKEETLINLRDKDSLLPEQLSQNLSLSELQENLPAKKRSEDQLHHTLPSNP